MSFERDLRIRRISKSRLKNKEKINNIFQITPKETEIIVKEFKDIKTASRALGISSLRLTNALKSTPYNEYETCLDFFNRHAGQYSPHFTAKDLYKESDVGRILEGTMPCTPQNRNKLLYSLLFYGYKKTACECCGLTPKMRPQDGTYPFILTLKDMKKIKDFSLDNLQVVCYNCSYTKMSDYAYSMKGVKKLRKAGIKLIEKLDTNWEAINYNLDNKLLTETETDYNKQFEYLHEKTKKEGSSNERINKLLDKFAKVVGND